jgi:hypothetical protein
VCNHTLIIYAEYFVCGMLANVLLSSESPSFWLLSRKITQSFVLRSEVIVSTSVKMALSLFVEPYNLVKVYRRFKDTCDHLPVDGVNTYL